MTIHKSKRSVLIIAGLLLATFTVYYATDGHVLAALSGFLAIILFLMADIYSAVRMDDEEVSKKVFRRKKRNLIVVGIFGTGTAVAIVALMIAYSFRII